MVDDVVDAAEVVGGLHDIVHVDGLAFALALAVGEANRVGLEDIACLVVGQFAALDVVGVVRQINLCAVIDAAAHITLFLFAKSLQKGRGFLFAAAAGGQRSIRRDAPGLAGEEGALNFPGGAPVAHGPFGQAVCLGKFCDRNILQIGRHSRWRIIGKIGLASPTNLALFADIGKKRD